MVQEIQAAVKEFILKEFLPGENPDELTGDTPLISGGILDSIATLKLVAFLEERFGVKFKAYEMDAEHLDTLTVISALIQAKKA